MEVFGHMLACMSGQFFIGIVGNIRLNPAHNPTFSAPVPFSFFFVGGEQCNCNLTVLGTQSSGSYVVNSCVYQFGSGASDPGCNALNDTGTYTNSSSTLTITSSTGEVSTYR